jgi:hypothetical protein
MTTLLAYKMFKNYKTTRNKSTILCVLPISVRPSSTLSFNRTYIVTCCC